MESEQMETAGSDTRSSPAKLWVPPCALAVLIFLLSIAPGSYYPGHPEFLNKIVHFMEFGLLGFFLTKALQQTRHFYSAGILLWTIVICATFGFLNEAFQFLVPTRMFDLMDVLFDSAGAAAGSGLYVLVSTPGKRDPSTRLTPAGDKDD